MRNSRVVSITLPPAMFEQARALAKDENRTLSELVREALRHYERERLLDRVQTRLRAGAARAGVRSEEDVVRVTREARREIYREEQAAKHKRTGTR